MISWILTQLGPDVRLDAYPNYLRIQLNGKGNLTAADEWPLSARSARKGANTAIQAAMALEMGLAEGAAQELNIPYMSHGELAKLGLDLLTLWTEPSQYLLYIQSSGSLGLEDFKYVYRFYSGPKQIHLDRMGIYIRSHENSPILHLDSQTHALVEAMDSFNALPSENRRGGNAWLAFSKVKECAKGVGAQLDEYLASNNVIVPPKVGLSILEEQDGSLSFLPTCEGVPEEGLTSAFLNSRDGQDLYTLQGEQGGRIRVVMGESQRAVLDRMRKVRRMRGEIAGRLRADPTLAFEGYLDTLEPTYSRRVVGVGDWKPMPIPHAPSDRPSLLDTTGVDLSTADESVDLAWPRLKGSLETPTTIQGEALDTKAPFDVALDSPEDGEAFVHAMRAAQQQGAPSFEFRGQQLAVDPEMLEDLESGSGPQRPKTKRFLLIYTDEEGIQSADQQEVQFLESVIGSDGPEPTYQAPRSLLAQNPLKVHQEKAVAWLQRCIADRPARRGALLADEMGLGKTLEVLTFAAWCLEQGSLDGFGTSDAPFRPMLIVAPLMLVENETWQQDMAKFFAPDTFGPVLSLTSESLTAYRRFKGQETELGKPVLDLDAIRRHRVVITNYDTLTNYQHSFAQADEGKSVWSLLVTDEAQNFKTPSTRVSHAIKALHPDFHIACTGTPVENRLLDVWNLFDALQPALLGSAREFKSNYEKPGASEEGSEALDRLRNHLKFLEPSAFLLRREKSILPDFPPKSTVTIPCRMDSSEVDQHISLLKALSAADRRQGAHLACLHRLVMLYQHPKAEESDFEDLPVQELLASSSKLRGTLDRLQDIRARGEKALLFARHIKIQHMLARVIGETFEIPVDIINGSSSAGPSSSLPGSGRAHRSRILDAFKSRPGFQVLVLSPFVAGVGLTITEANHVIHYGRWWNPAVESQATDRVYRIGQQRPVSVHLPILSDKSGRLPASLDERLHDLLERKHAMARDFLSPGPTEKSLERELYQSLDEDLSLIAG